MSQRSKLYRTKPIPINQQQMCPFCGFHRRQCQCMQYNGGCMEEYGYTPDSYLYPQLLTREQCLDMTIKGKKMRDAPTSQEISYMASQLNPKTYEEVDPAVINEQIFAYMQPSSTELVAEKELQEKREELGLPEQKGGWFRDPHLLNEKFQQKKTRGRY